jgi:hypothetical protein
MSVAQDNSMVLKPGRGINGLRLQAKGGLAPALWLQGA